MSVLATIDFRIEENLHTTFALKFAFYNKLTPLADNSVFMFHKGETANENFVRTVAEADNLETIKDRADHVVKELVGEGYNVSLDSIEEGANW